MIRIGSMLQQYFGDSNMLVHDRVVKGSTTHVSFYIDLCSLI